MIYCVWYPSGGFGHFVNAVLTLHGNNFVRPVKSLEFSTTGDSHSLDLVVPKYFHDCWSNDINFDNNKNYCVLIDNGITNQSDQFKSTFPDAVTIKICYTDNSWPVVAHAMIEKAMQSSIDEQLPLDAWNTNDHWARREKYFLFLRDHDLRSAWRPDSADKSSRIFYIDSLIENYNSCFAALNTIVGLSNFEDIWIKWRGANSKYIDPVATASTVISHVVAKRSVDLSHITDIWAQAVIYYYIWTTFGVEVPHNDFSNFIANTNQILELVS